MWTPQWGRKTSGEGRGTGTRNRGNSLKYQKKMRLWLKVLEDEGDELGKENEAIEGNWSDRI